MTAGRDELRELIEELPDDQVSALLEQARRHLRPVGAAAAWPPAFFGSFADPRTDLGRITEVATPGHRHFRAVRPRHADALTLLP